MDKEQQNNNQNDGAYNIPVNNMQANQAGSQQSNVSQSIPVEVNSTDTVANNQQQPSSPVPQNQAINQPSPANNQVASPNQPVQQPQSNQQFQQAQPSQQVQQTQSSQPVEQAHSFQSNQPNQPNQQFEQNQQFQATQPQTPNSQLPTSNFQPPAQLDVTKQGPTKKKTLAIIGGLVGVSAIGVFLTVLIQSLVFGDVAGDFNKLTTYEDSSGYVLQIPEEWQIEDGRQVDRFARDLEDQNSLAGIVVSNNGSIPGYSSLNDSEKDQRSIENIDEYSNEILSFYQSTGSSANMINTSTTTMANSDRSMSLEADVQTSVGTFRAFNAVKIFSDGTAYAIAVVVPLESWDSLSEKIYKIVNDFKVG